MQKSLQFDVYGLEDGKERTSFRSAASDIAEVAKRQKRQTWNGEEALARRVKLEIDYMNCGV